MTADQESVVVVLVLAGIVAPDATEIGPVIGTGVASAGRVEKGFQSEAVDVRVINELMKAILVSLTSLSSNFSPIGALGSMSSFIYLAGVVESFISKVPSDFTGIVI
jgi:hypothetical protein